MSRPIAISLSPNTSKEDVRLAWRILFTPSGWKDREVLQRAAHEIVQLFPSHFVTLTSSGRQALFDVLRSYDIHKGDEVLLQAFTCIAVPEPIIWTGATPIYVDILKDTYSMDPQDLKQKITPNTKAIILQHTFGIPGPLEEVLNIAREHNLIVIEDCAHALGILHNGKPLGTFGDAAILSFGRDKCISSVFGGAVITKDKNKAHQLQVMQNTRKQPPASWIIQQLLHPILFSFILPTYFVGGIGKVLLVLFQKLSILSWAVAYEERQGGKPSHIEYSYSPALGKLLLTQLHKVRAMNERRRAIVSQYKRAFSGPSGELLRFPLNVVSRNDLILQARDQRMLLGDWYDAPLVPAASNFWAFRYIPGSCPTAEKVSREVINLPTYPALTDTQVTRVISYIQKYAMQGNHK